MSADHGVRQGDFFAGAQGAFGIIDRQTGVFPLAESVRPVMLRLEKAGRGAGAEVVEVGMLHALSLAQVQKLVGSLRVVAAQIDAAAGRARKEIDHLPPRIVLPVDAAEMAVFAADDAAAEGEEIKIVRRLCGEHDSVQMREGHGEVHVRDAAIGQFELEAQFILLGDDRNRAFQLRFFQQDNRLKAVRQRLDRSHPAVPGVIDLAADLNPENPGGVDVLQNVFVHFRAEKALQRQLRRDFENRPKRPVFKHDGRAVDPAGRRAAGTRSGG